MTTSKNATRTLASEPLQNSRKRPATNQGRTGFPCPRRPAGGQPPDKPVGLVYIALADASGCAVHRYLMGEGTENLLELGNLDRRRIHNLKYFTWIEQQKKSLEELNAQWNEFPEFWDRIHRQMEEMDLLTEEFNKRTGVLENL